MCTILTFDREFYNANRDALRDQIESDGVYNDDGFSLLLLGADFEAQTFLQTFELEPLLDALDLTQSWQRAWVHCRAATTAEVGLPQCHGFLTKNFAVFHNGALRDPKADRLDVDSRLIATRVADIGMRATAAWLVDKEPFANVFMIDLDTGRWLVSRSTTGSLHTDGKGNYSTHAVAAIDAAVKTGAIEEHRLARASRFAYDHWDQDWSQHSLADYKEERHYLPSKYRVVGGGK